jgi:hypothetical protein
LLRKLCEQLTEIRPERIVDLLIRAGELEATLSDADEDQFQNAAELTNALAELLCSGTTSRAPLEIASRLQVPEKLSTAPPEGFTYYALHPLDFARVAERILDNPARCAILGIRSIGTTLSAVVLAALRAKGRHAERITVRPTGHPYDRRLRFSRKQLSWIQQQLAIKAQFLVVDEGPGRSGSTFLSVAEGLEDAGVPRDAIIVIGSRAFEPSSLCAQDAVSRWQFLSYISTVPSVNTRFQNCLYMGGGEWRTLLNLPSDAWPECWTQMERLKFLTPDRKVLYKFEGMGPRGEEVRRRAFALAEAELVPAVEDAGDGFLAWSMVSASPMSKEELSTPFLEHVARYLAYRFKYFSAQQSDPTELGRMLEFNLQKEFGFCGRLNTDLLLTDDAVVTDGRVQPFEWITSKSRFVKVDAISHGENHFFPGPCDIAWDLAGAAVEWEMSADARDFLLSRFRKLSGYDVSARMEIHALAYCIFRLGFCKMAMSTVRGSAEEKRLYSAYRKYSAHALRLVRT